MKNDAKMKDEDTANSIKTTLMNQHKSNTDIIFLGYASRTMTIKNQKFLLIELSSTVHHISNPYSCHVHFPTAINQSFIYCSLG